MKITKPFIAKIKEYTFDVAIHGRASVKVKIGQNVKIGDVLYETEYKRVLASYNVVRELGISLKDVDDSVVRLNGEYVTVGEILAERLTAGGLILKKVFATVDGLLSLDRLEDGYIDILSEHTKEEISCKFNGRVVDINHGSYIKIASRGYEIPAIAGLENEKVGGIVEIIGNGDSVYTTRDLSGDYKDKVVFAGRFAYPSFIEEIIKRGATMVFVWSMDYYDYVGIKDKVVVLGGFGQIPFDHTISHAIKSFNDTFVNVVGKKIYCADIGQYTFRERDRYVKSEVKVNDIVRIIDSDNYSALAKVVDTTTENGYSTISLLNGERMLINNELIQLIV